MEKPEKAPNAFADDSEATTVGNLGDRLERRIGNDAAAGYGLLTIIQAMIIEIADARGEAVEATVTRLRRRAAIGLARNGLFATNRGIDDDASELLRAKADEFLDEFLRFLVPPCFDLEKFDGPA